MEVHVNRSINQIQQVAIDQHHDSARVARGRLLQAARGMITPSLVRNPAEPRRCASVVVRRNQSQITLRWNWSSTGGAEAPNGP